MFYIPHTQQAAMKPRKFSIMLTSPHYATSSTLYQPRKSSKNTLYADKIQPCDSTEFWLYNSILANLSSTICHNEINANSNSIYLLL